jgi:hypothetical protein
MVTATYEEAAVGTETRLLEPQEIPLPCDEFTCARMPRHLPWADVGSLLRIRPECRDLSVRELRRVLGRSLQVRRRYPEGTSAPGSYASTRRAWMIRTEDGGSVVAIERHSDDLDPDRALRCRDEMRRRARFVLEGAPDERDLTTAACLTQLLRIIEGTEIR